MTSNVKVAVVDDPDLRKEQKLLAALDRAGLWDVLEQLHDRSSNPLRIVIKPDFGAFTPTSPTATDPELVEALVDALHDRGHSDVAIGAAAEASGTWADNRDAFALAELLGYRLVTTKNRRYDVSDLSSDVDDAVFPSQSALHGTGLSKVWANADVRIVFCKNKTDEFAGYALCLESLLGVLPLADKHLHYGIARDPGEVVADLLSAAPVHFAIIDGLMSAHGAGGSRAPASLETATIIASPAIGLADQIGAIKMGLDPFDSAVFAKVLERHPMPRRYEVQGSLSIYPNWRNVPAVLLRANRYRAESAAVERLVKPWLQHLDSDLFPLKSPIDTQINGFLAEFFRDTDTSQTSRWLLIAANLLLGVLGHALECYRVLFDKDALRQKAVGLGLDLDGVKREEFDLLYHELLQLEVLAAEAPEAAPGFRWRYLDEAILFSYSRVLPIAFNTFVDRVDVARTIQYMNDYLGGVVVALERDHAGRPVRQAERNLYLPQPNYMVLYHGKSIDVTKLEVVEYRLDRHRLFWKTIRSENASATFDDGIATFSRCPEGTTVTIMGRQLFTLPPFWQMIDLNLVPDIKAALVNHAYLIFFDRTVANFESLVEGRSIRLGRRADEPHRSEMDRLVALLEPAGEIIGPLLGSLGLGTDRKHASTGIPDPDGFVHMRPGAALSAEKAAAPAWVQDITRFVEGFLEAVQRDLRQRNSA